MGLIIIPGRDEPDPEPDVELAEIPAEELDALVREAIAANKTIVRTTRSQETIDRCVEVLHEEGELHLAAGLLMLAAARVTGREAMAASVLMQLMIDAKTSGALGQTCRVCGCTNDRACPGGCRWVEFDLCSACDRKLKEAARRQYFDATLPGPGRDG